MNKFKDMIGLIKLFKNCHLLVWIIRYISYLFYLMITVQAWNNLILFHSMSEGKSVVETETPPNSLLDATSPKTIYR